MKPTRVLVLLLGVLLAAMTAAWQTIGPSGRGLPPPSAQPRRAALGYVQH